MYDLVESEMMMISKGISPLLSIRDDDFCFENDALVFLLGLDTKQKCFVKMKLSGNHEIYSKSSKYKP